MKGSPVTERTSSAGGSTRGWKRALAARLPRRRTRRLLQIARTLLEDETRFSRTWRCCSPSSEGQGVPARVRAALPRAASAIRRSPR